MEHPIFQKIDRSSKPDFGEILSKSFQIFKDLWVEGLLHGLLSMLFVIPLLIVVYAPLMPMYIDMLSGRHYDPYYDPYYYDAGYEPTFLWLIAYMFIILALSFVVQIFVFAINAHFYKCIQKADTGEPEDTGSYFIFLKGNFGKILLLNLAAMGIAILAALLCYLPLFYVMVPINLITVFFVFNPNLSVGDTIKACFKFGNKYWLIIFGLIIVSSLIAQLGIILCFVGVIITAYFVHIPLYYLYKDSIGLDEDGATSPEVPSTME